jgi:CheY-like chemotaxis protein
MKQLARRSPLEGIALTDYSMEQDIARSQKAGFAFHLTKPVRMESLDQALASVMNQKPAASEKS